MCASRIQEVRCAQKIIHSVQLSVVETFMPPPGVGPALFGWLEDLVHRRIEVGAIGIFRLFRRFDGLLDLVKGKAEFSVIPVPKP